MDFEHIHRAAELTAKLAYPAPDDKENAALAMAAMYTDYIRQLDVRNADWGNSIQPVWVAPLLMDQGRLHKSLRMMQRRLKERAAAGRMAMAYVLEYLRGADFVLPAGMTALSLDQLSRLVLADTGESFANNVENRIWRASLPVAHVAAAAQVVQSIFEGQGRPPLGIFLSMQSAKDLELWESWISICRRALTEGKIKLSAGTFMNV